MLPSPAAQSEKPELRHWDQEETDGGQRGEEGEEGCAVGKHRLLQQQPVKGHRGPRSLPGTSASDRHSLSPWKERWWLRFALAVLLPASVRLSPLPTDCSDVYRAGSGQSGVYTIYPAGPTSPVQVYCDMSEDRVDNSPEKWTVIQRRQDGTVNFYMKWDHYKRGFGSAAGEYWLGLETMHLLTQAKKYELRVDMEDFDGQSVFAQYSSFAVGPEAEGYKLSLGSFVKGAAGDSLSGHNGMKFTTIDKDQDTHDSNCAQLAYGAFWHYNCFGANPNGLYTWGPSPRAHGVMWRTFKGLDQSLKTIVMKIRPAAE